MENAINGDWAVVTSGNRKFVGRVLLDPNEPNDSHYVVLNPCYEYYSEPVQAQSPTGRVEIVGRTRMILPFDHTLDSAQVTVFVSQICFFKHMSPKDQQSYEKMVEETRQSFEAQRVKRDSGIVLASSIPPNGGLNEARRA